MALKQTDGLCINKEGHSHANQTLSQRVRNLMWKRQYECVLFDTGHHLELATDGHIASSKETTLNLAILSNAVTSNLAN